MDKDVVHIYNGILLSHKKKQNWVIYTDVDGPRNCHAVKKASFKNTTFKIFLIFDIQFGTDYHRKLLRTLLYFHSGF